MPLTVTVLGLVLFGALHNVLELRYVQGRFANVHTGRLLGVLVLLITGIAVCRLIPTRTGEILLGYAVLAAATVWALRRRWMTLGATMGVSRWRRRLR